MPINPSRFKAIWPWLAEARYVWLSTAVICVALIISLRPHTTEPVIRLTGLLLQLLGIGSVIWGISETRAHMTRGAGANPTIEARLDALEKNVTSIHERISQTQKEMDEEFHKITGAVKLEKQSRQAEDNAIRVKLEVTGAGGVHISAIGASWLFVGIILSTPATEIAALLK